MEYTHSKQQYNNKLTQSTRYDAEHVAELTSGRRFVTPSLAFGG